MEKPGKRIEWAVWGGLILVIATIAVAFAWSRLATKNLPLPVLGQLPEFSLTNQDNQTVSLGSLRGKVWVADVIFTRCPGPCARMTRHLAELQAVIPGDEPVRFVSFTSDPEYDTPAVLKRYAERFNASPQLWSFLTGSKKEIRGLAVNDFKFVVVEKKPEDRSVPDDLFLHSTWFVLVDSKGQVRGWTDREGRLHAYFDSEDSDARAELESAIARLLREKET